MRMTGGGTITLTELIPEHLGSVLPVFRQMGCRLAVRQDAITLLAPKRLHAVRRLCTMPYPGFPTDAQAPMMALLSVAEGTSMVVETIFEFIVKINKMGKTIFLVEQNANLALETASYVYVLENGRIVNENRSEILLRDDSIKKAYLGI